MTSAKSAPPNVDLFLYKIYGFTYQTVSNYSVFIRMTTNSLEKYKI